MKARVAAILLAAVIGLPAAAQTPGAPPPPPPQVLRRVVLAAPDHEFPKFGPCYYAAIGADRQRILKDTLRAEGAEALEKKAHALLDGDAFMLARRCDPNLARHLREAAMVVISYTEMVTALSVLTDLGATREQLDGVSGPDIDPLLADFRAGVESEYTGLPRTAPIVDSPEALDALLGRFSPSPADRSLWANALIAYYLGRDLTDVINTWMLR